MKRLWERRAADLVIAAFLVAIGAVVAVPLVLVAVFTTIPGGVLVAAGAIAVVAIVAYLLWRLKDMPLSM